MIQGRILTCSFVDAEHGDAGAGTPGRQFRHLIHQCVKRIFLLPQAQEHTEMLRQSAEDLDILLNQLRCAVVIVDDGQNSIGHSRKRLVDAKVQAVEEVDQRVQQQM